MEYLTLRDIPHRHYHPLSTRTMSSEDHHRTSEKALPSMAAATHHMRNNSPPIQPGEQRQAANATLPSFQQLMQQVQREPSPPSTPSRRHGSLESSPVAQAPQFDDVAWAESSRRRTEAIPEMHHRSSNATEHQNYDSRRTSVIDPALAPAYSSPRASHQSAMHMVPHGHHHHRPSLPFPSQQTTHLASHARHQSSPVPQSHAAYHSHAHSGVNPSASYAQLQTHGMPYDPRSSYYPEHHTPSHGFSYERPHDPYVAQSAYAPAPHPSYDSTYYPQAQQYNYQFQSTLGMDQNSFNRKRRGNLPKEATGILKAWFNSHRESPYPTEEEKLQLCSQTNLTMNQVSNWFINARRRAPQKEQRDARDNNDE